MEAEINHGGGVRLMVLGLTRLGEDDKSARQRGCCVVVLFRDGIVEIHVEREREREIGRQEEASICQFVYIYMYICRYTLIDVICRCR